MSDASHSASGATDCRLMVQLPLLVRGMLTMSNCTSRQSGWRSSALATRCYDGALIRYRDGGRTVTVVGSSDFMTNDGLLHEGNAALAMNLAGDRPRLIWYAPHHAEGENPAATSIYDLIPANVTWITWQLALVVALVALLLLAWSHHLWLYQQRVGRARRGARGRRRASLAGVRGGG